jgi:hypothetical protein
MGVPSSRRMLWIQCFKTPDVIAKLSAEHQSGFGEVIEITKDSGFIEATRDQSIGQFSVSRG